MLGTSGRFALAALAALVTTATLSACTGGREPAKDPDASAVSEAPKSAWQQTLDRIKPDGTVDVETALAAFALAIGPVPGATVPKGPPSTIGSGTVAVDWVLEHWSELSAEQQAAVAVAVGESAYRFYASPTPGPPAGRKKPGSRPPLSPNWPCHVKDSPGAEPYRTGVETALRHLETNLYHTVDPSIAVVVNTRAVKVNGEPAEAYAVQCSLGRTATPGQPTLGCTIHVNPGLAPETVSLIMAHEVVHCYMDDRMSRGNPDPHVAPAWFTEGLAEWIAWTMVPPDSKTDGWWRRYLHTPTRPLFKRSYDAAGFFARLTETGSNVWSAVDPMIDNWVPGPNANRRFNEAAWEKLKPSRAFLQSWGSGFVRGRYPGTAWDITGPDIPADRPTLPTITITHGSPPPVVTLKAQVQIVALQLNAEVISLAAPGAFGRMTIGNGADATLDVASSQLYCTLPAAKCTCPPGSPGNGTRFAVLGGKRQYLGFTGGLSSSRVTLSGSSLDETCRKSRPRVPDTCPTTATVTERVSGNWTLTAVKAAPDGIYTDKEFQDCTYLDAGADAATGKQVKIDLYPQIGVRVPSTRQAVIATEGVDRTVIYRTEFLVGVLVEAGGRSMITTVCNFDGRGGGTCDETAALALTRHVLGID